MTKSPFSAIALLAASAALLPFRPPPLASAAFVVPPSGGAARPRPPSPSSLAAPPPPSPPSSPTSLRSVQQQTDDKFFAREASRAAEKVAAAAPAPSKAPTPEESARQLTDYMSKAHEEKLRAVADAEGKLKGRIQELEAEVEQLREELESRSPTDGGVRVGKSYLLPATNKALAESVLKYREFVADYLVKSQREKAEAVAAAEAELRSTYEERIAELLTAEKGGGGSIGASE